MDISTVSNKHDAIMNWLIANPAMKLGDVAREFGVSQPWLSTLIHSDAFQHRLREKQDSLFALHVAPLAEKLNHLAHKAIDQLSRELDDPQPARLLLETAKYATDSINFSGKTAGAVAPQGGNTYIINSTLLAQARERILQRESQREEGTVIEHDSISDAGAEAPQLPPGGERR